MNSQSQSQSRYCEHLPAKALKATKTACLFGETWCRGRGSNPHGAFAPEDFKSSAYAISPPRLLSAEIVKS